MEELMAYWTGSAWSWGVLGLILIIIELFLPGVFFLWFGLAGLLTGAVVLLLPDLDWRFQWLLFAVLGCVLAGLARVIWAKREAKPGVSDDPNLNRRASQYVGRTAVLEEPITNGRGRIHLGDSEWAIAGPDLPVGTTVRVVGAQGTVLNVMPAETR